MAGRALPASCKARGADQGSIVIDGPGTAFAMIVAGLCASRMGGHWRRTVPALLLPAGLFGAWAGGVHPGLDALGSWAVLASAAMAGMLIVLPRPHSAPSAVVAAALLAFGMGAKAGMHASAGLGLHAILWWTGAVVVAAGLYATGALLGKRIERSKHAPRRFVGVGVGTCLICGAWIAHRVS